ncbi:hypothetical protein KQ941_01905 [Paenibacillus xylanexedens]|uniref:hypothetical protein n=1 Tax=Paenibacillus xylanexedens TaxID=528191 RepID=UPI001F41DD8A|nr:hypothetical protein [Paenibacillus xylanexedens]MCF7753180.1 hypothetical protein [Paenibacillus xylanexedens]
MILLKIKYIGGADATLSVIKEQGVNEVFDLRNDGKAQEGFPIKHTDISIQLLKIGMIRKNSLSPAIQAVTEDAQEGKKSILSLC